MAPSAQTTRFRFQLWLIRVIGVIVPRRLRADWRPEWEAELRYREMLVPSVFWRSEFAYRPAMSSRLGLNKRTA